MSAEKESVTERQRLMSDDVCTYYVHQYDRLAKLEEQSLRITNIVIGLSVGALTFGFSGAQSLTEITGLALPAAMVISNLFAMAYVVRTSGFTRVHRSRAKRVLELYSPDLFELDKSIPFPRRGRLWSRERIVLFLHGLLILVSLIPVFVFLS